MKILFKTVYTGWAESGDATHGIIDLTPETATKLLALFDRASAFRASLSQEGLASAFGYVKVRSGLGCFKAFMPNYDSPACEEIIESLGDEDSVVITDRQADILLSQEDGQVSLSDFHVRIHDNDIVCCALERQGAGGYLSAALSLDLLRKVTAEIPVI